MKFAGAVETFNKLFEGSEFLSALQNQNMWVFRPKKESILSKYYLYFYLPILTGFVKNFATGSAREFFCQEHFNKQKIVIPDLGILNHFDSIIKPVIDEIDIILWENQKLNKSRNLLLSRLISGKLSVEDLDIKFPPSMEEADD